MTDLAEVAASVAKALELKRGNNLVGEWFCTDSRGYHPLWVDGSNLTDPYWIWRCVEWLRTQNINLRIMHDDSCYHGAEEALPGTFGWSATCPAAEFPARAIHELMRRHTYD